MTDLTPKEAREFFGVGHTAGEMAAKGLAVVAAWEADRARLEEAEKIVRSARLENAPFVHGQAVIRLCNELLAALAPDAPKEEPRP